MCVVFRVLHNVCLIIFFSVQESPWCWTSGKHSYLWWSSQSGKLQGWYRPHTSTIHFLFFWSAQYTIMLVIAGTLTWQAFRMKSHSVSTHLSNKIPVDLVVPSQSFCLFQEKICEDSASFDLTSTDIASAVREIGVISTKIQELCATEENSGAAFGTGGDTQGLGSDFTLEDVLKIKR